MSKLIISESAGELREYELGEKSFTIGRSEKNDIKIMNDTVSREHGVIEFENHRYWVEDLESTAGVLVNGKKILKKVWLEDGDEIKMGATLLTVELDIPEDDNRVTAYTDTEDMTRIIAPDEQALPAWKDDNRAPRELNEDSGPGDRAREIEKTIIKSFVSGPKPARPKHHRLLQVSEEGDEKQYVLDEEKMMIGRNPDCHIPINDNLVSNYHAILFSDDHECVLEDLHSKNGTLVNGTPIQGKRTLDNGDEIEIGPALFRFFHRAPGRSFSLARAIFAAGNRKVMASGLALFSVAIIAITVFMFMGMSFDGSDKGTAPLAAAETKDKGKNDVKEVRKTADARVEKGIEFLNKGDWAKAITNLKEALDLVPGRNEAVEALRKAEFEQICQTRIEKGLTLITNEEYGEGIRLLETIPEQSVYYNDVLARIESVRQSMAETVMVRCNVGRIREAPSLEAAVLYKAEKGKTFTLIAKKGAWYGVTFTDGSVGWGHESIFRSARPVEQGGVGAGPRQGGTSAEEGAVNREKLAEQRIHEALTHYAAGDLPRSLENLDQLAEIGLEANSPFKARADAIRERIEIIANLYQKGLNHYNNSQLGQAFKTWARLLSLDQELVGDGESHFSRQIAAHTAEAYYLAARAAFDNENYQGANENCSKALRAFPGHAGCAEITSVIARGQ